AAIFEPSRRPLRLADDPAILRPDPGSQGENEAPPPAGRRHGVLVEFVRLIMVALFAVSGWELASLVGSDQSDRLLIGTLLGAGVGYVLGGVFGRRTATAVSQLEREFRRIPAAEILAGGIGLILGLVLATLLAFPLYHLPAKGAYPAVAFVYLTLGYLTYKLGRAKSEELFGLL